MSLVDIEERTDHLGNVFKSKAAMCRHYGISVRAYNGRVLNNWSKKDALTFTDNASSSDIEQRTDHLGNVFKSKAAMCKHYGIDRSTYDFRIRECGWDKEKALTHGNSNIYPEEERTDHLGKVFNSITEMANHYGKSKTVYLDRIKSGYSKQEALTADDFHISPEEERTDHLGNVFKTKKEMCKYYHIKQTTYMNRINCGYSKEEALGIIPLLSVKIKNKNITDNINVIEFAYDVEGSLYFKCKFNDKLTILSKDDILKEYRKSCEIE